MGTIHHFKDSDSEARYELQVIERTFFLNPSTVDIFVYYFTIIITT